MLGRILGIVSLSLLAAIATGARAPVAGVRMRSAAQAQVDSGVAGRWTAQITGDSKIFTVNFTPRWRAPQTPYVDRSTNRAPELRSSYPR